MLKQKQQNHHHQRHFHPNILGDVIILHFFKRKKNEEKKGKISPDRKNKISTPYRYTRVGELIREHRHTGQTAVGI